jgi:hypothetical protein
MSSLRHLKLAAPRTSLRHWTACSWHPMTWGALVSGLLLHGATAALNWLNRVLFPVSEINMAAGRRSACGRQMDVRIPAEGQ